MTDQARKERYWQAFRKFYKSFTIVVGGVVMLILGWAGANHDSALLVLQKIFSLDEQMGNIIMSFVSYGMAGGGIIALLHGKASSVNKPSLDQR